MPAPSSPRERNPTMTKADLVDKVTGLGDLTRRDGEIIVDTLFEAVIGALKSGDKIEIRGFGSFRTRQRNARVGRNPKTGDKVEVPAKRVPSSSPRRSFATPSTADPRRRDRRPPRRPRSKRRSRGDRPAPSSGDVSSVTLQ